MGNLAHDESVIPGKLFTAQRNPRLRTILLLVL